MPNVHDVSDAYLDWENTEAVTLTTYVNEVAAAPVSISHALRRGLTRDDRGSLATYEGNEVVWNLPNALMSGSQARPGDLITAGSEVWTILSVQKLVWGTRWRCVCRLQR
jgi:hypothetical protein